MMPAVRAWERRAYRRRRRTVVDSVDTEEVAGRYVWIEAMREARTRRREGSGVEM